MNVKEKKSLPFAFGGASPDRPNGETAPDAQDSKIIRLINF